MSGCFHACTRSWTNQVTSRSSWRSYTLPSMLIVARSIRLLNRRSRRQAISGSSLACQSWATSRSGVSTMRVWLRAAA